MLGGDGRGEGFRLRGREAAQLEETAKRRRGRGRCRSPGDREAHVLQVFQELHTRVAPEEAHEIRVRPRAEGAVPLLHRPDEATRTRLQTHPSVPSRSERLRDRSELKIEFFRNKEREKLLRVLFVRSCNDWQRVPMYRYKNVLIFREAIRKGTKGEDSTVSVRLRM